MDIQYTAKPRFTLKRTPAKRPNECRLATYSNAIAHITGSEGLTAEDILAGINATREKHNLALLDITTDVVPNKDMDDYVSQNFPSIVVKRIYGERFITKELFTLLLDRGYVFSLYHQMVYDDYFVEGGTALSYLPGDYVNNIIAATSFNYSLFKDFIKKTMAYKGDLSLGHTDLVLDVVPVNGVDSIIYANLNSVRNETCIALPFNLINFFCLLDWDESNDLTDITQLPDELQMTILRNKGKLSLNNFSFIYGMIEIFCERDKLEGLDNILWPKVSTE